MIVKIIADKEDKEMIKITLPDVIRNNILNNTACPKARLDKYYMNKQFNVKKKRNVCVDDLIDSLNVLFSSIDEKEFWNKFLTNNGEHILPVEIKGRITKFSLPKKIEDAVVEFLMCLAGLVTDPLFCYTTLEEDEELTEEVLYKTKTVPVM